MCPRARSAPRSAGTWVSHQVVTRVKPSPWLSRVAAECEYKIPQRLITEGAIMKKIQVQGVHHTTIVGSTKQSAIDFWSGVLGMPFVLEQPNLGKPDENHLYFDPGDGRLLTVFTNESLGDARRHAPREVGCVEHIAFNVSRATFMHAPARLRERGIEFIQRDRGFMDSIYLRDPNGLKVELACYKFETPEGCRAVDVLMTAQALRVARGDHHITDEHLADAIEQLLAARPRLRPDGAP